MPTLKLSPVGYALLRHFEQGPSGGFASKPYRCSSGEWTNGWGNTIGVTAKTPPITAAQADKDLARNVAQFERDVNELVKVPLTQGQFDALVCFAFNVGSDIDDDAIAEGLGDSTLLRKLNARDYAGAARQFDLWVNGTDPNTGKRIKLAGLVRRRSVERKLFETGKLVL